MKIVKIALTGGPCAGKTTIFNSIRTSLENQGFKVITVPESATELIRNGLFPPQKNNIFDFQDIIFNYQKVKETNARRALDYFPQYDTCVILCDRGIIDNKAYLETQKQFDDLLKRYNCHEILLLDSYDLVLDLITTADCKPEAYNLYSNNARMENIEEAKKLDRRTSRAWLGHRNIKVLNSTMSISEEVQLADKYIKNLINDSQEKKLRYFELDKLSDFSIYNENNSKLIEVEKIYLNDKDNMTYVQYIILKRTYKGMTSYIFRAYETFKGTVKIINDQSISEYKYFELISKYGCRSNYYEELSFIKDRQIYTVRFCNNQIFLEIEENELNDKLDIPHNLVVNRELEMSDYKTIMIENRYAKTRKYSII